MKEYVVITGASSGIGRALAVNLANQGYLVLAIGRDEIALRITKSLAKHGKIIPLVADLSYDDTPYRIADNFQVDTKIKYLIHCAATPEPMSSLLKIARSKLRENFEVNVVAPIFLMQKLSPYFSPTTRVLFIGSDYVGANKVRPNVSGAYGISKSAVRSAVEHFRYECENIAFIGYLNPGATQTKIYANMWAEIQKQGSVSNIVQPASPIAVAEFIANVLENSSQQDFSKMDWDYRNVQQRNMVKLDGMNVGQLRSKL